MGLVLMGGAMLSKPLIQFSVDGWRCRPSLISTWGQTMVEIMKILTTYLKRPHASNARVPVFNHVAGLHQPTPSPARDSLHSWASPEQSPVVSLFLSPGSWCTKYCCALQESISQSSVSSGNSMMGLTETSSKRTYALPTLRAPVPWHSQNDPSDEAEWSLPSFSTRLWDGLWQWGTEPTLTPCWNCSFDLLFAVIVIIIEHNALPQKTLPFSLIVNVPFLSSQGDKLTLPSYEKKKLTHTFQRLAHWDVLQDRKSFVL